MRSFHFLFVALLLCTACGSDDPTNTPRPDAAAPTCSTATCSGCCQDNQCIKIPTTASCGLAGVACVACGSGEVCKNGGCEREVKVCNASNCAAGCCEGGTCQPGSGNGACGIGGGPCHNCQLLGGACSNGRCEAQTKSCASFCPGCCQGESCLAGTGVDGCGKGGGSCQRCSADQRCVSGSCGTAGQGNSYDIYLERVTILTPLLWCEGELTCDPQLVLTVNGKKGQSTIQEGNDVTFGERLLQGVSESDLLFQFKADLYDDDTPFSADSLGSADANLTKNQIASGTLALRAYWLGAPTADITFRLEKL